MEILINDTCTLSEIGALFSAHFPYLKLQFYGFEPDKEKVFRKENRLTDLSKTLKEVRHNHLPGSIGINGHQKVSTLEHNFSKQYGLNVQVFRKSGETWLQTITTDDWTLAEQNKMGFDMSRDVITNQEPTDFDAYHEQL